MTDHRIQAPGGAFDPQNFPNFKGYDNLLDAFPLPKPRDEQKAILGAMEKHMKDPKIKVIMGEFPTGIGKAAIAMTVANKSTSAYVFTADKILQDQYMRDFKDILIELKGKSNYKCTRHSSPDKPLTCDQCPCKKSDDPKKKYNCFKTQDEDGNDLGPLCEYPAQLMKASESRSTLFNFASGFLQLHYNRRFFKERKVLVIDEAHLIPDYLTSMCSINIGEGFPALFEFPYPQASEEAVKDGFNIDEWITDLKDFDNFDDTITYIKQLTAQASWWDEHGFCGEDNGSLRLLGSNLKTLQAFLSILDEIDKANKRRKEKKIKLLDAESFFVVEKQYRQKDGSEFTTEGCGISDEGTLMKLSFRPVRINFIFEILMSKVEKIIMLSATFLSPGIFCNMLGIKSEEFKFLRCDSPFPPENRILDMSFNIGRLSKKNLDESIPALVQSIDMLLEKHGTQKGIIHGITYKICEAIMDRSDHKSRILFPKQADERNDLIEHHASTKKPTILLSPSMTEGVDLRDDLARFCVWAKMPYPYMGDPVLKKRIQIYKGYYELLVALKIVQGCGRGVRSKEDYCTNYMMDAMLAIFIRNNKHLFPPSFLKTLKY